jgi:hypothetical protein
MGYSNAADMTLIFALEALERLVQPGVAVSDAQEWSEHIGVVSEESFEEVRSFLDRHDVRADFTSGDGNLAGSLAVARQRFPTERHVFLGTGDADRELAQSLGWEYLDVDEAAGEAGWQVVDE